MNCIRLTALALTAAGLGALTAPATGEGPKAKSDPPGARVELRVTANKATYDLDLGGKTPADYRKQLQDDVNADGFREPPKVDLSLEFVNTGDQDVKVQVGGDATELRLSLDGPGVVHGAFRVATTDQFIFPKTVTIAPGKSHAIPLTSLEYGTRGGPEALYWTDAGDYVLTAEYRTAVSPAPAGAKDVGKGFGKVTLSSAPVTLHVKRGDDADVATVARSNREFALDLYGQLKGQDGNLFFSPYSISTALAMTRAGARGETAAQMDRTLHFTLAPDKLHPAFAGLIRQVNGDPGDDKPVYQLSTANALWGQKGFSFKPDFLKVVKDNYGGGLNNVDFAGDAEQARRTINAWVEKQTHDRIKDLLPEGEVDADTRLVLTNAIYFNAGWDSPFEKSSTKDRPFRFAAGKSVKVPMMHQTNEFGYLEGDSFQALELPFSGGDLSMVVLLPRKVDGLADLEKDLTADRLAGWLGKLDKQPVAVTLPKFKTTQAMKMNEVLIKMGMPLAFTPGKADLSGTADAKEALYVSAVVHKAFIDVNEEGAEAAAAGGVGEKVESGVQEKFVFRADHPFVFLIRDRRTDSILFLGRLADPGK
jgi:serpin B